MLTFQPDSASSTLCTALTTAPDGGEESNETVVVHVVPVAPDTTPGGEQRSLTVNILNNDGKHLISPLSHTTIYGVAFAFSLCYCRAALVFSGQLKPCAPVPWVQCQALRQYIDI